MQIIEFIQLVFCITNTDLSICVYPLLFHTLPPEPPRPPTPLWMRDISHIDSIHNKHMNAHNSLLLIHFLALFLFHHDHQETAGGIIMRSRRTASAQKKYSLGLSVEWFYNMDVNFVVSIMRRTQLSVWEQAGVWRLCIIINCCKESTFWAHIQLLQDS